MGFPPPPDLPTPPTLPGGSLAGSLTAGALSGSLGQAATLSASLTIGASFDLGPPVASLCGFQFPPSFFFSFGFTLNIDLPFSFPPDLPFFSFGLNCSLNNPLDVTVGLPYGGGRFSTSDPDPDLYEEAA